MARMNKILVIAAMATATTALAASAAHKPRPVVFETPADDELRGARVRHVWWSKSGGVDFLVNCLPCDAQGTFKRTDAATW